MPPEMIKGDAHDRSLDIWCLGILLYELLHGYTPYGGRDDREKCANIMKTTQIQYSAQISSNAVELLESILKRNPKERISMAEIFNHSWMTKFEQIYNMNIESYITSAEEALKMNTKVDESDKSYQEQNFNQTQNLYEHKFRENKHDEQSIHSLASHSNLKGYVKARRFPQLIHNENCSIVDKADNPTFGVPENETIGAMDSVAVGDFEDRKIPYNKADVFHKNTINNEIPAAPHTPLILRQFKKATTEIGSLQRDQASSDFDMLKMASGQESALNQEPLGDSLRYVRHYKKSKTIVSDSNLYGPEEATEDGMPIKPRLEADKTTFKSAK